MYPLVILKIQLFITAIIIVVCPYWLDNMNDAFYVLLLQSFIVFFAPDAALASSVFYKCFPIFKRFTYASFTYAMSRAVTYIITSFGFVYLVDIFGNWGTLLIMVPICVGYAVGLRYFEKLDRETDISQSTATPVVAVNLAQ
jgi:hypothetical protein